MLATTKMKGGYVSKKVYHIQIRSIRGFKINWLEVKIKCKGAVNESSECVLLFDIIVVVILGEFVCVLLTKVLGFGREQYKFSSRNATSRDKNLSNAFNFYVKSRDDESECLRERFGSSFKNSVHFVMNSSYDFLS